MRKCLIISVCLAMNSICLDSVVSDDAATPARYSVRQLQFDGNDNFDDAAIRTGLKRDSQMIAFLGDTGSTTDSDAFGKLVCERMLAGYRNLGYANATVIAETVAGSSEDGNADHIRIVVAEGVKQLRGSVRVSSPAEIPASEIEAAITGIKDGQFVRPDFMAPDGKIADRFPPVWKKGNDPGDLAAAITASKKAVSLWCELQGYMFPTFAVTTQVSADKSSVDLVVQMSACGPQLAIASVEFSGLRRHTTEELTSFLALPVELKYSDSLRKQIVDQLEESGRFLSVRVWPDVPFGPDQAVPLHIDVVESPHVPKLSEQLSDAETCMVRFSKWLKHWHEGTDDLVIDVSDLRDKSTAPDEADLANSPFELSRIANDLVHGLPNPSITKVNVVLSPNHGLIASLQAKNQEGVEAPTRRLFLDATGLGISVDESPWTCVLHRETSGVVLALSLQWDDRSQEQIQHSMQFHSNFRQGLPLPSDIRLGGSAAIFADFVRNEKFPISFVRNEDGTAILSGERDGTKGTFVFDYETGRLIRMTHESKEAIVTVRIESGAYQLALASLKSQIAAQTDIGIADQWMISAARYLLSEFAGCLRFRGDEAEAKLIESFVLGSAADKLMMSLKDKKSSAYFAIPGSGPGAAAAKSGIDAGLNSGIEHLTNAFQQPAVMKTRANPDLQKAVTESQIMTGVEHGIQENPSFYDVGCYLIAVCQTLDDTSGERLASVIEKGEVSPQTTGINIRPFLRLIQVQEDEAPEKVFHDLFPILWTTTLRKYFSVECTSLTGGGPDGTDPQFNWHFQFGDPPKKVRPVSSSKASPITPIVNLDDVRFDKPAGDAKSDAGTSNESNTQKSYGPIQIPSLNSLGGAGNMRPTPPFLK